MNKIQISLLIVSLWGTSCSSGPKETKESPKEQIPTATLPKVPALQVTFTLLDSLSFFPDAILELNTPLSNQVFKPGKVPFEFNIKNFSLKKNGVAFPRLAMILNGGDPEGYSAPIFQRELTRGTYRTVAFLVDQRGLSLKNFGNYLDRDFLVGDSRPFPYSAEPYLAINLPRSEQIIPLGEDLILDFLVLGGDLKLDGLKVKIWINGYQTEMSQMMPLRIENLPIGDYQVKVQLLRITNKELEGPFSSSMKTIYVR
ncbi:MAG: hypothetical protein O2829_01600 [Bacteroidetes bacterium]|nr:hypothetical protein [Bacteroidota bacterium]